MKLKFRGLTWQKSWVYGLPIRLTEDEEEVDGIQIGLCNVDIDPKTLGMSTNIMCNGKEIYSGDIIGRGGKDGFNDRFVHHDGTNFVFYFYDDPIYPFILYHQNIDEYDSIIGNIFDNPELFPQEQLDIIFNRVNIPNKYQNRFNNENDR